MGSRQSPFPDQVHGARAAGKLLAGDLDDAVHALEPASGRYLVGFCLRLALIAPGFALYFAWRLVRRRFAGLNPSDR